MFLARRRLVALCTIALAFLLHAACSKQDPRAILITKENEDSFVSDVVDAGGLPDPDMRALANLLTKRRTQRGRGELPTPIEGLTIGEAITIQNAFDASEKHEADYRIEYRTKLALSNVMPRRAVGTFEESVGLISGEIKNTGDRTVEEAEITIYFLDGKGQRIHEVTHTPILADGSPHASGALKAGSARKWAAGFNLIPDDWSGKVDVKVTNVKLAAAARSKQD